MKSSSSFITKMFLSVFMAGLFTHYLSAQSINTSKYFIKTNDENKFISYPEASNLLEFTISTGDYGLLFPIIKALNTFLAIPWLYIAIPFKSINK